MLQHIKHQNWGEVDWCLRMYSVDVLTQHIPHTHEHMEKDIKLNARRQVHVRWNNVPVPITMMMNSTTTHSR
jgi:hypothetical protein